MPTTDELVSYVQDALKHLYDYSHLESHPLARLLWPVEQQRGPSRAHRLSRLLLEYIEKVHPATDSISPGSHALYYMLLVYRYVEEWPVADIMVELGYSRRQLFRKQAQAIAVVTALLKEELDRATGSEKTELAKPAPPAPPSHLLDTETKRLLNDQQMINLAEVSQEAIEIVMHLARQRGARLACDVNPDLPAIQISSVLMRQILVEATSSLITQLNASLVRVRARLEGTRIVVELVAHRDMPKGSPRDTAPHDMLELGTARHLIETMGGRWTGIHPASGGYTCLFSFPAARERLVLVIDDNEDISHAFRRFLTSYGYQVRGVTANEQALQLAIEIQPAAITLDIMMPTQDGWDIIRSLKSNPATQQIPVIVCSVLDDPELAYSLGAAAYLQKPVAQTDLVATLGKLFGTW